MTQRNFSGNNQIHCKKANSNRFLGYCGWKEKYSRFNRSARRRNLNKGPDLANRFAREIMTLFCNDTRGDAACAGEIDSTVAL
jgi:hypothetical protein